MSDRDRTRRRFLATTGAGLVLGFTGCATQSDGAPTETTAPTSASTPTETEPPTETETPTEAETDAATETEEGPGYKHDHWHGRLFFEVNGELVDFDRSKYYLEDIGSDHPDAVYFHFHEDAEAHGPNEWSNEKKIVTFQRALDLLPGIGYEQQSGEHVVTYDGTTYDARESGTTISIEEGHEPIDPTTYEVAHDDNYYVQVVSEDAKRTAEPAHTGADLGTLLFDLNNIRVDFSRDRFLGADAASQAFHFHDDGNPYMWYREDSVTLAEALNSLPGVSYAKESGSHVVTYDDPARSTYSQTYDGSSSENEIIVRQRTTSVDPTSYALQAGDVIWVYVKSDRIPENEH